MTAEESKDLRKYSDPELEKTKEFASSHHSIARLLPFSLAEIEAEIASRAQPPIAPAEESQPSEESNH